MTENKAKLIKLIESNAALFKSKIGVSKLIKLINAEFPDVETGIEMGRKLDNAIHRPRPDSFRTTKNGITVLTEGDSARGDEELKRTLAKRDAKNAAAMDKKKSVRTW